MQCKTEPISLRDTLLLSLAFGLSGISSGVFAATVLTTQRTLLDFDWLLILSSVGLGMFGGLTATIVEVRRAAIVKEVIDIPLQVASDLLIAALLSGVAFAIVSATELPHEYLLGSLLLAGFAGQKVLTPLTSGLVTAVIALAQRLAGKAEG